MKENKYDTADKKPTDELFEENPQAYSPLQNYDSRAIIGNRAAAPADESSPLGTYLKQAFLFLPGTFLLFFISLGSALAVTDPTENNVFSKLSLLIYAVGLLSFFMTWFGFGDIKNKKHLVIPGSIIVSGAILGLLVRLSAPFFWLAERMIDDFGYAVLLFPIGLIAPVLAKGWVDRKSEND